MKYLAIILSTFIFTVINAKECDYKEIRNLITSNNLKVHRDSNFLHKKSLQEIEELADMLNYPIKAIKIKAMHEIAYEFSNSDHLFKSLSPKSSLPTKNILENKIQFEFWGYKTEKDAIKAMDYLSEDLASTKSASKNIMGINTSDVDIERVGKYIIYHLYNDRFKTDVAPILAKIKNCNDFNFEYFFSKSTLPIKFTNELLNKKEAYRNTENEFKAVQNAMYTSELTTKNSFNENITLESKEYHFKDKYYLSDVVELDKVVLHIRNNSKKSFFSVDIFVIYYDINNSIIDVVRAIKYSVEANDKLTIESFPSRINASHARKAHVAFAISNLNK